jgi:hypothetical protein
MIPSLPDGHVTKYFPSGLNATAGEPKGTVKSSFQVVVAQTLGLLAVE